MSFDPRITAYFGDAVLRAGFMPLPHLFLRHYASLGLSTSEAMFLLHVMEINWDLAAPPKSAGDLARRMGVDTRTIRRYSESLAAKQLIVLYDQFDERGAQIENGYDLAPLFARLAALEPEPPLGGTVRRRARRDERADTERQPQPANEQVSPDTAVTCPPDSYVHPPADTTVTRSRADRKIRGRRIAMPGLKEDSPNKQNSMMHDDHHAKQASEFREAGSAAAPTGYSLGLERALDEAEVRQSADVLRRIGVDDPVRSLLARSLAPEEAWGLWGRGRARGWSVPLLIAQVYNKRRREPQRAADLPDAFLRLGRTLARLDPDTAECVVRELEVTSARQRPAAAPRPDVTANAELHAALAAALPAQFKPPLPAVTPSAMSGDSGADDRQTLWQAVQTALQGAVDPGEYETWLRETALLQVDRSAVVVGVPNVFVRDAVAARYRETLQIALAQQLGAPVQVEVVVGA